MSSTAVGNLKVFHLIPEFFNIEEIEQSLLDIYFRLKLLRLEFIPDDYQKKVFFAVLNCSEIKKYFSKDIDISSDLEIVNPENFILSKIYSKVCLKVLVKLEVRLILRVWIGNLIKSFILNCDS